MATRCQIAELLEPDSLEHLILVLLGLLVGLLVLLGLLVLFLSRASRSRHSRAFSFFSAFSAFSSCSGSSFFSRHVSSTHRASPSLILLQRSSSELGIASMKSRASGGSSNQSPRISPMYWRVLVTRTCISCHSSSTISLGLAWDDLVGSGTGVGNGECSGILGEGPCSPRASVGFPCALCIHCAIEGDPQSADPLSGRACENPSL